MRSDVGQNLSLSLNLIFQLREKTNAISLVIYFFLYTTDIFRTKTDILHFLGVNVMFYDAVSIIHDVITTRNPFPYTAKFMFVCFRNNETQQVRL